MATPFEMMKQASQETLLKTHEKLNHIEGLTDYINGFIKRSSVSPVAQKVCQDLAQGQDIIPALKQLPENEIFKLHESFKAYLDKYILEAQREDFQLLITLIEAHHFSHFVQE